LLHDVGKGMPVENHVTGSLQALDSAALRLHLEPQEKDEVQFLIQHHLDMSATLRRDIFDPETIVTFSKTISTGERLARLCLLTYADIHAVNPEALTPWKAEMLWQLFAATYNQLNRSLDRDRLHAIHEDNVLDEVLHLVPGAERQEIEQFLEGFPRRYLAVHPPAEIAAHFSLYKKLNDGPVQTELQSTPHTNSLTLVARDRPALFATIAGVLSGWSMNIIKAEAFANDAGIVLDTFQFVDLHRTLELNPGESERLRRSLVEIVSGQASLAPLLKAGLHSTHGRSSKVAVYTRIRFDDESAARSTLLEILTQDRPGLLQEIGSVLAQSGCNIEVALIDTEGHKAIDVFYLTHNGGKLSEQLQDRITTELRARL
jgi:[protein-PII] uridylyltransferase